MQEAIDHLKEKFGSDILESGSFRGDEFVVIGRDRLIEICKYLKDDKKLYFKMLIDICGADYPGRLPRFEVVYHLYSVTHGKRIRLKVRVDETDARAPSVSSIWKAANWFEREAFDLFGINFEGHPNLRRLLTYEGFKGHALRKDYPINKRQHIPTSDPLVD